MPVLAAEGLKVDLHLLGLLCFRLSPLQSPSHFLPRLSDAKTQLLKRDREGPANDGSMVVHACVWKCVYVALTLAKPA